MAVIKTSSYHFQKLKDSVRSRIADIVFYTWDPLTAWLEAIGRRAGALSSDIDQLPNTWFFDAAKGRNLDRRLGINEDIPRLPEVPANDGTVTLLRQSEPSGSNTFPAESIRATTLIDPSDPGAERPEFVNIDALTIATGSTTWTVAFKAVSGGANTNLPDGTPLQLITQGSLFDTAEVASNFTNGQDVEDDAAYVARARLIIRSRTKGTYDALIGAALTAGAAFAYASEPIGETYQVVVYACSQSGTLSAALEAAIRQRINGDRTVTPIIPMVRAAGIAVDVQQASTVTYNFSIPLVLRDSVTGDLLTSLRADIEAAITAFVQSLNTSDNADRVMRINRIKDICIHFRERGVLDVDDDTFLPADSDPLTSEQYAVMGTITWL